jgi:tripeptidyl-peptidase-2
MRSSAINSSAFPAVDLVPKKETETLEFLNQYPEYDGRNVLIGVLDTGIDPGAVGIRYMADGTTPKLLDLVDCTGSGDVDITTKRPVTACEDDDDDDECFQVQGLSGKTLKLRKEWWKEAPSADSLPTVQLGIKRAYELFPDRLVARVKAHRKKELDVSLDTDIANVRQQLYEWQQTYDKKTATPDQLREKSNLQALKEFLTDKEWEDDPGMMLDCVVFFDGQDQRAVIFNDDDDSTTVKPLAAFSKERKYGTISVLDQYNYGVNFYDDNKILSIVGDCTPHGTHVAAIAAAAEGERNGVAPGAQLVSIKIGDSRMGSMESGSSIARGIMAAVRLGCDVINLSYGEASQVANSGRLARLAEEMVWRHNIIFVSAVGNNGPALTTVNAPGGITSCVSLAFL